MDQIQEHNLRRRLQREQDLLKRQITLLNNTLLEAVVTAFKSGQKVAESGTDAQAQLAVLLEAAKQRVAKIQTDNWVPDDGLPKHMSPNPRIDREVFGDNAPNLPKRHWPVVGD